MRSACKNLALALLVLLVLGLLLFSTGRGDSISELRRVSAPYQQDLVRWEITHFLDKWWHLATGIFRSERGPDERLEVVLEYFELRNDLNRESEELRRALAASPDGREHSSRQAAVEAIVRQRANLAPTVEETLESVVAQIVDDLGIVDQVGPVRWPPVDFTFEPNGLVLVRSPRDRVFRLKDFLLRPDVSLMEQVNLETQIESMDDNTSALVVRIGGVATYPAQVTNNASLHGTLSLVSHEWLHHWLFFRPLGRAWFAGGELTSINETVANMFGEEVGDLALERLTGTVVGREPWVQPALSPLKPDRKGFDFRREMRETRGRLEELLRHGDAPTAEAYLESRRLVFVENGFDIRKLNNAWFAFHGTYADSGASISPIEPQLRAIRNDSDSLAEFLDRVSLIDEEGELEKAAVDAGWQVPSA